MEPVLKSELPRYFVLEGPSPTLQIILAPGQSIKTDLSMISYLSKSVTVKKVSRTRFLICRTSSPLAYKVKNKSGGIEYLGLASSSKQQILAVNPEVLRDDFIVQDGRIIAVTNDVSIEDFTRDTYLMLKKIRWLKLSNKGLVFLQASSSLIEKRLGVGEEIQVNHNSLFAYSNSVTLTKSTVQSSVANAVLKDWLLLKCKGPGIVYIESPGNPGLKQSRPSDIWIFMLAMMAMSFLGALMQVIIEN
mmetsp:Transcript_12208/g.23154  ORF Transcript_12208/g.23154 Transcript_12208/m.23154 type:complete len:247 (-) Transcript_12208:6-746(-)